MNFLTSIVPTAVVLGILIIIHEFGHFLACRLSGVKVEKFSIGFGPEIFRWQGKETRYVVSLLPLGGFVKPSGETIGEVEGGVPKPGDYLAAPLASRIFIVVSGVLMNYILAFFIFFFIFMIGRPIPGTVIGGFIQGYPAKTSGLKVGDEIIKVGTQQTHTWRELTDALEKGTDSSVPLTVRRNGAEVPIQISPRSDEVKDIFGKTVRLRRLGITPDPKANQFERFGPRKSLKSAWETEVFLTVTTHKAIFYLITGRLSLKTLSGPIGIITMAGNAAQLGLTYLIQLTGNLSISLAVINLLPIPALDGGHFLFLLIEGLRRKRLSLQFQERATQVGFFLLLALMTFIIYNDLVNIDAFDKIKGIFLRQ